MKRYESYKSTGLNWFPEIPHEWEWRFLSQVAHEQTIKKNIGEMYPVLTLSYGEIKRKENINAGLVPSNYDSYQMLFAGNIVLRLIDLQNDHTSLRTGLVKETGIITSAYTCISPTENAAYLHYLLHSYDTKKIFYGFGGGVRQSIGYKDIRNLQVPVPPREEQDQIVRYLDWQVSKINRLIAVKKRKIELIHEYRQTVIDSAVTHGIDDVPMKDSGVNWIGRIPQHWNMVYAKKLFYERKDKAFPFDEQLTASQKYGVISQQEFMRLESRRVTMVQTGSDILKHVGKGDFVISMRSFQGGLEYSLVDGKISSAYVMIIPFHNKVYDEYYKWLLKSAPYINALQGTSDLVRDGQALRFANFVKVFLPEIPIEEQKRIADYVNTTVQRIDALLPEYEKQILLLQELRTRLISDVVTGQIDVRGIEIPDFEYTPDTFSTDESEDTESD